MGLAVTDASTCCMNSTHRISETDGHLKANASPTVLDGCAELTDEISDLVVGAGNLLDLTPEHGQTLFR